MVLMVLLVLLAACSPMLLLWIGTALAVPHARWRWRIAISAPAALGFLYSAFCVYSVFRPGAPESPQWPLGIMCVGAILLPVAFVLILIGLAPSRRMRPD